MTMALACFCQGRVPTLLPAPPSPYRNRKSKRPRSLHTFIRSEPSRPGTASKKAQSGKGNHRADWVNLSELSDCRFSLHLALQGCATTDWRGPFIPPPAEACSTSCRWDQADRSFGTCQWLNTGCPFLNEFASTADEKFRITTAGRTASTSR